MSSPIIIRSNGRLPRVLDPRAVVSREEPIQVELERAHELVVHVLDEAGIPIQGARVEVDARGLGRYLSRRSLGEGNPLSAYPIWAASTDFRGSAVLRGLPRGHLYVTAWHDLYVPHSLDDDAKHWFCDADASISITLKPLYGVVFEGPSPSEVVTSAWRVEGSLEILGGHVIAAAARGREALRDRFPGCFVHAHRPQNVAHEVMVSCWVVTRLGHVWSSRWPLRPIAEIHDPVYMEPVADLAVRRLKLFLQTPSGVRIPATLGLRHTELGFALDASPGVETVLPEGKYRLSISRASKELGDAIRGREIEVSAGHPATDELAIVVDREFVRVAVRAKIRGRAGLGVAILEVAPKDGRKHLVTNWDPATEVLELYEPPGTLRLCVRSPGYEEVTVEREMATSQEVEIELVERRSAPRPK